MRKTKNITIDEDNRDHGKIFLLTEMPALDAERWATRAFLALSRSGVDIGDIDPSTGMAGIAILGIKALAGVHHDEAFFLMDEMFRCIQIVEQSITRRPTADDIEEVSTLFRLRKEVFSLHTGFSLSDIGSQAENSKSEEKNSASTAARTFPAPSLQS